MPYLSPDDRKTLLAVVEGRTHGPDAHVEVKDYCRSCDVFYFFCCESAQHAGHRVYRFPNGRLDLSTLP